MARENLKAARRLAGLTQQAMADKLGISLRNYIYIESGQIMGKISLWDELEDFFGLHQRYLREIHPDTEDNQ